MTIKDFIKRIEKYRLTGKVYRLYELNPTEEEIAKDNGFVIVFGYSVIAETSLNLWIIIKLLLIAGLIFFYFYLK